MVWFWCGMACIFSQTVDFDLNTGPTLQWPLWEAEETSTKPTRLSLVRKFAQLASKSTVNSLKTKSQIKTTKQTTTLKLSNAVQKIIKQHWSNVSPSQRAVRAKTRKQR